MKQLIKFLLNALHFLQDTWLRTLVLFFNRNYKIKKEIKQNCFSAANCRRYAAVPLLFILLYSQLGYYFAGKISQLQIRLEIKERILSETADSSLEAILLYGNEKNIDWKEEGKEFSFKGKMYDVVRIKIINGQTVFFCINDKKEEQLLEQINDITKYNQQHTGKANHFPAIKLVYDAVVIPSFDYIIFSVPMETADAHYLISLPQQIIANATPPPRV